MTKKSKIITNLLVIPFIASTIFLASPALAADPVNTSNTEIRHKTHVSQTTRSITGIVVSVNGSIIVVMSKEGIQYTVDASTATIMKDRGESLENPDVVDASSVGIGDAIVVRGMIDTTEVD